MQKIKYMLVGLVVLAVVTGGGYMLHLELVVIPRLMERAQFSPIAHLVTLLLLTGGSAIAGGWLARRTIFTVYDRLISNHLNPLAGAIGNLATGYWAADASTQKGAFTTGAKMGYALKSEPAELDRAEIAQRLEGLNLPARQANGQSADVVNDMARHMDSLDSRKARLTE